MNLSKKNNTSVLITLYISGLIFLLIPGCSDKNTSPETSPVIMKVSGVSQKGPFIVGSSVTIQELNENFSPNGNTFGVATSDNLGSFDLESEIATPFVEIICTGFYYNEVAGDITDANLTLRIISPLQENLSSNLNILTTLSRKRIIHLMKEGGLDYETAKLQAEEEVLNIFSISLQEDTGFEQMDISQTGEANAALLAISIMLQGNNNVSDLSLLVSTIIEDIEQDGILDDATTRDNIISNARDISIPIVLENLQNRYQELGITIEVPDFEPFISNVWQNIAPAITIQSPAPNTTFTEGEEVIITALANDEDGEVKEINIFLNDTLVSETSTFSWVLSDIATPQTIRVVATDDDNASSSESVSFSTRANDAPILNIVAPVDQQQIVFGSDVNIEVEFSDPDGVLDEITFYMNDEVINESFIIVDQTSMNLSWTVDSTLPSQELKIELTDNLKKTTTETRTLTLKPGIKWNELGNTPFALLEQAGSDGTSFYFAEAPSIYLSSDGFNLQSVLTLSLPSNYLIQEPYDNKMWVIESEENTDPNLSTTMVSSSSDGITWSTQTTNYISTPTESFVFNNILYVVNQENEIHQFDNANWSLATNVVTPWEGLPTVENVSIVEFNGIIVAVENALLTLTRKIWSTTDLQNWNEIEITVPDDTHNTNNMISREDGIWLFSNGFGPKGVYHSIDGITWDDLSTGQNVDAIVIMQHQNEIYLYNGTSVHQMETFGL